MAIRRGKAKGNPFKTPSALGTPTFVIGAETGGNTKNVAIQLRDADGKDLAVRGVVEAYVSDDANGDVFNVTAVSGGVAVGTDGTLIPVIASKRFTLISEADGDIDLNFVEAAAKTVYLNIINPDGTKTTSGAITFA